MPITLEGATAARDALRRLPRELKAAVKDDVLPVAQLAADDVQHAGHGVYSQRVAATAKARKDVEPVVAVGSARRVLSGGAKGNQLWGGVEFGTPGTRYRVYSRRSTRGQTHTVRRRTTRQFLKHHEPFIMPTFAHNAEKYYDAWEQAVYGRLAEIWDGP